jgi:hypothetical protein
MQRTRTGQKLAAPRSPATPIAERFLQSLAHRVHVPKNLGACFQPVIRVKPKTALAKKYINIS